MVNSFQFDEQEEHVSFDSSRLTPFEVLNHKYELLELENSYLRCRITQLEIENSHLKHKKSDKDARRETEEIQRNMRNLQRKINAKKQYIENLRV
jgi:predicted RNase H-like nuclease (RuvC/YqgF family)